MAKYQTLFLITVAVFGVTFSREETLSTDAAKPEDSTLPSLGREVEDNSRYKTLEANATLLKLLVDDKDGVSRSEVFDMLHSRDEDEDNMDLPNFAEDTESERFPIPDLPDAQAEFLQGPSSTVRKDAARYEVPRGEPFGAAAAIMVAITCAIVCLAYAALIVWRRIYLKRNGLKHELLRNEENVAETRIEVCLQDQCITKYQYKIRKSLFKNIDVQKILNCEASCTGSTLSCQGSTSNLLRRKGHDAGDQAVSYYLRKSKQD
ncbi:hypothetical protein ACJJTC_003462 [Scirpophaga incertulas]